MREARLNGMDPTVFASIDKDGTGVLSMEAFQNYYRNLHASNGYL